MPRATRTDIGDYCYHIINRANARLPIFFKEEDYVLFENVLELAQEKFAMRILAYCLIPNHFHLILHPKHDKDIGRFMQWLTLTHTQRWHTANATRGTGHLYQGRYKSFLIEDDPHLLSVIRYVERNPLRAKLVKKAENWGYSSLARRCSTDQNRQRLLATWPVGQPNNYLAFVNTPQSKQEEENIRLSVIKGKPFGSDTWATKMIKKFNLGPTIRPQGRPRKGT